MSVLVLVLTSNVLRTHNTIASWHVLPRDKQLGKQWMVLSGNDNLRTNSDGTLAPARYVGFVAVEELTMKTPLLSFRVLQNG